VLAAGGALKYASKKGRKPRPCKIKLTEDESAIEWSGARGCGALINELVGQPRRVLIADMLDISIGAQSDVFKRNEIKLRDSGSHLFLSIVLLGSLPPRPDEIDEMQEDMLANPADRTTLDLRFDDEMNFGLVVSAIRELLAEGQQRKAAYAMPFNPLHASAGMAVRVAAPRNATCYEKGRDALLLSLDLFTNTKIFIILVVIWALAVCVFGAMCGFMLFGWHYFRTDLYVNATAGNVTMGGEVDVDHANMWFNICIQVITAEFTLIPGVLTLPWRLANALHLCSCRRKVAAGLDFYGRPTKGIW
jgi:hypothetical protein